MNFVKYAPCCRCYLANLGEHSTKSSVRETLVTPAVSFLSGVIYTGKTANSLIMALELDLSAVFEKHIRNPLEKGKGNCAIFIVQVYLTQQLQLAKSQSPLIKL